MMSGILVTNLCMSHNLVKALYWFAVSIAYGHTGQVLLCMQIAAKKLCLVPSCPCFGQCWRCSKADFCCLCRPEWMQGVDGSW